MTLLEITGVSRKPESESVRAWWLDEPVPGTRLERTAFELSGWVVGAQSPAREVWVIEDGILMRRIPLEVARPDVVAAHPGAPERSGFWSPVGTLGLERDFTLVLRAILEDETRVDLATICGRRPALEAPGEAHLQPLLLTSLGRTGTTLLMGMLSAHPAIVADRTYPYEVFPARYWLHLLRVLSEPANHRDSAHPGDFAENLWKIGSNPFDPAGPLDRRYAERLARFCRDSIDEFYRALAESQGKPSVRFFAEKFQPDHLPRVARELYPGAKEIFLTRDFRDLICSVFAFNEKRRTLDFGRERVETDEQYVGHFALGANRLVNAWKRRKSTSHLIRYEDLAIRPAQTIGGVLEYLGLDHDPEIVDAMVRSAVDHPEADGHRTTRTAEESVGRWRSELPPSLHPAVRQSLNPALSELGYEVQ